MLCMKRKDVVRKKIGKIKEIQFSIGVRINEEIGCRHVERVKQINLFYKNKQRDLNRKIEKLLKFLYEIY